MVYQTGIVTGTFTGLDAVPSTGSVSIRPSVAVLLDAADDVVLSGLVSTRLLGGTFTLTLPATDDATLNPTGFGYTATVTLASGRTFGPVTFALPAGTTVDLVDLIGVDPATFSPTTTYVSTAQLAAEAATRAAIDATKADTTALTTETSARTTADALKADKTTTVNGHPLSANVTVTATDVGLGSVNNTADSAKPVSTAQAAANVAVASARLGSGVGNAFAGVLATLRRGQRSTCVAAIGDSTGDNKEVGTGIAVDEWMLVLLKRLALDFPGYTLLERQWNDTNQSYDQPLTRQTGTINAGAERHAVFTTTSPGALQYTGATITGDIDVRARIAPTSWAPAGGGTIAAKWDGTGGRSWLLLLDATGALSWNWSTTGAAGVGTKLSTATIPATANPGNGNPLWVRAVFDVDNGAAGNDLKFYYSTDGTAWTQLGTTITTATATTIFAGTSPYQIGSFTSGFSTPLAGKVYKVEVHSGVVAAGVNGASVVPYLPDDWDYLSAETTVAFGGAPVLMFLNGSQSGQNVAYFDNATRRAVVHQPHGQAVLLINTAHNDNTQSRAIWLGAYNTMVTNLKALIPYVPIVAVAQNPTGLGGAFSITAQGIELRAARGAILQQWAASQAGVWSFDAWPLLTAADTIDQLHPTTGAGSGAEKWGLGFYARAFPNGAATS